ncbi:uncharacterized protein [Typha latifolia]|uniref:uncharacterized protein isoform X1 n=1 Tax=Typha latifolia TaxID=4733 RepID=UPI003C2E0984
MSNTQQMFNSGKAHGEGEQGKVDQWTQSAKDTASSIKGGASQSAQEKNEHAAGILQQTGEQMKQMAQGATGAVKNAVGMGNANTGGTAADTTTVFKQ